jgi:DNA (cytosine-5)-methyltransferase 1
MKALDLFCSAGGVSMGLHRAGFDVEGVDIEPQPNYPFPFRQMDALTADLHGYDLICASPPCQKYTKATLSQRTAGKEYPDLIAATREKLLASGVPWIMENVPGAPMRPDVILCGSMFGLRLVRHRWFECSFPIFNLMACQHPPNPVVAAGHGTPSWVRKQNGGKGFTIAEVREAMGIDWMNRDELSLAIPPAYSEFLARQFLKQRTCETTK